MTQPFDEVRFPVRIALGSTGGPMRKTDIVSLTSGYEERNSTWYNSRRKYDVGYGIKSLNDMHTVLVFFEARNGRLRAFRFKDRIDYKSCPPMCGVTFKDQQFGTGDGATAAFQITKTYTDGVASYVRNIKKPVRDTLIVGVNGVVTTAYTVDWSTGIVTFSVAPPNSAIITWGGEFDTPVRFDTDEIMVNWEKFNAGTIQNIPLIEVRV